MSDSDELDIDDGEAPEASTTKKKRGGLGAILPTILKFAAIGIGALIFIVTVSVVTYSIMSKGGKSQTVASDPTSPYMGKRPVYEIFRGIETITTKSRDTGSSSYTISVQMYIGYDKEDQAAASELNSRKDELQDFMRRYFAGKYAADMQPENEERLKRDIQEILNTRFLDTARARIILFPKFDIMETY